MESSRRNDYFLLAAMALGHGYNDFCAGVTGSMIPTLEARFSLTLGAVAGMVTLLGVMGNLIQPLSGWYFDRTRTAVLLLATPLLSGMSLLVGFTQTPWQASMLFLVAGISFGLFHPLSFLLARSTLVGRPALATAIYISFGFFGVSTGSWVAGAWLEHRGLENFHLFYIPGWGMLLFFIVIGLHRRSLDEYRTVARAPRLRRLADRGAPGGDHPLSEAESIPFSLLVVIGLLVAIQGGTLVFFLPKLFHTLYGSEGLGGRATFLIGLTGGLLSYGYAAMIDRGNPFRVMLVAQLLGVLPLIGFFHFPGPGLKTLMVVLFGATTGAIFAPLASLAPSARGLSVGMRSALMIGGVWGMTSILNFGMALAADHLFSLETVMASICFVPLALIPLLIHASRRYVH